MGYKFNPNNKLFSGLDKTSIEFLGKMLTTDLSKRPTAQQLLQEEFITSRNDVHSFHDNFDQVMANLES